MTKKNVKPYGSSNNRNRTLSNKNNSTTSVLKKNKNQVNNNDNSLEATTKIRIDSGRINDAESLDTSFLEGRLEKKVRDNNKAKEKILKEKRKILFDFEIIKWIFFSLAFLCIVILAVIYLKNSPLLKVDTDSTIDNKKSFVYREKENVAEENIIDSNYLFVGDTYIDKLDFSSLDYHYVKSFDNDLTTEKLLDNMREKIYVFNPSDIFIQVGINDLKDDVSIDDIISNYSEIIDKIKDNRPYANINIMALYYLNDDVDDYDSEVYGDNVDNDKIKKLNNRLNKMSVEKKVKFIEINDLFNTSDKLNSQYTDDGIYLNKDGNKLFIKRIKEYLE